MHPATSETAPSPRPGGDSQFFTVPDTYPNSVTLSSAKFPYLDFYEFFFASSRLRVRSIRSLSRAKRLK